LGTELSAKNKIQATGSLAAPVPASTLMFIFIHLATLHLYHCSILFLIFTT